MFERTLIHTLEAIQDGKEAKLLKKVKTRKNGQVVAKVFPNNIFEILLLNGIIKGEIWMEKGVTEENLIDTVGLYTIPPFSRKKNNYFKLTFC